VAAPSKSIRSFGRMKNCDVLSRSRQQAVPRVVSPPQHELSSFDPHDDRFVPTVRRSLPIEIGRQHERARLKLAPGVL
jgi:hypothetical protein